jgi:hypothetical protein
MIPDENNIIYIYRERERERERELLYNENTIKDEERMILNKWSRIMSKQIKSIQYHSN